MAPTNPQVVAASVFFCLSALREGRRQKTTEGESTSESTLPAQKGKLDSLGGAGLESVGRSPGGATGIRGLFMGVAAEVSGLTG